jgi:isoleucyl-tRNA synthetase
VREVCSAALSLREKQRLRVRLPLSELVVASDWAPSLSGFRELIAGEVNVKKVTLTVHPEHFAAFRFTVKAKQAGPRLGSKLKAVLAATRADSLQWREHGAEVEFNTSEGWIRLQEGEWEASLVPKPQDRDVWAIGALPDRKSVVALEATVDLELEREGFARDLVRVIQQARKDAKLHISDRIRLRVSGDDALAEAVREHAPYIREQTLAVELELGPPVTGWFTAEGEVGEGKATVALTRA